MKTSGSGVSFLFSLNSRFYGSMESCHLACHLLICLHFTLLHFCFSTLPLNFRGGIRSLIAALLSELFVVFLNETEPDNLLLSSNKIKSDDWKFQKCPNFTAHFKNSQIVPIPKTRTDISRIVLRVLRIPIMPNSIGISKKRRAILELSIFSYCALATQKRENQFNQLVMWLIHTVWLSSKDTKIESTWTQ